MSIKNLVGKTFGRLSVIALHGRIKNQTFWECLCDCGSLKFIRGGSLQGNNTNSCGCLNYELVKKRALIHGLSKTRFSRIWRGMKQRCLDKNFSSYYKYGAKGIEICTEWEQFLLFKKDMYESYLKHVEQFGEQQTSIDRIDNNGHYCKENCRWVTLKEQARNIKSNRYLTYKGRTLCLAEWSEITGINAPLLSARLNKLNWSVEKTLTTPIRSY